MQQKLLQKIEAIEKELQSDPTSPVLWFQLLSRFNADDTLHAHPKRIESILRYIQNNPRDTLCKTPFVRMCPDKSKDGYETIKALWDQLLKEHGNDTDIVQGAASYYCVENIEYAKQLLQNALKNDPSQADLWLDLGRYSTDAKERLYYFKEARKHASKQPNLPIWILMMALEVDEHETVEALVKELLAYIKNAQKEYGSQLYWSEASNERWEKAFQITSNREAATALVRVITMHAEYKHYVHTALGYIALKNNDIDAALEHLIESGNVMSTPRLSSYGPTFFLAKKLCYEKKWEAVEQYLELCTKFWDNERLKQYITMVQSHEIPDF